LGRVSSWADGEKVLGRKKKKEEGKGTGRRDGFLGRGKEEKGEKKKKRWAGWAEKDREKGKGFPFLKMIQTHSI